MQNGVLVMGTASLILLLYTHGSVSALVVMYSINVFLTFSLSQFGMARFYITNRHREPKWKQHIIVHIVGLLLCLTILVITVYEKFEEGGWLTLLITSVFIVFCYLIRSHYVKVRNSVKRLEEIVEDIPASAPYNEQPVDPKEMTAVLLVSGFNGFGIHTLLSIVRSFPGLYKNYIFLQVAEIDSGSFKGVQEVEALKESVKHGLEKYVKVTRKHGIAADYRMDVATDVVGAATQLCESIVREFPKATVFTGKLVFRYERFFSRLLHNETAFAIQRRLQWDGITTVILPIRVDM
jgi:K+ transporter